jgi:F420-dependent oxidoreductase-like protein
VRIGIFFQTVEAPPLDELVEAVAAIEAEGFDTAWFPQSFGYDALTSLSAIGRHVEHIEFGTAVVPIFPRHPAMLAVQAHTANVATHGRLTLGVGLSDRQVIEQWWGYSFDRPARHMREYLSVLLAMRDTNEVDFTGETVQAHLSMRLPGAGRFPVLLAALAPRMLELAGAMADGTITWMTGPKTVESHIVPSINRAAAEAGRQKPRVVVALPTGVGDESALRAKVGEHFAGYANPSSYRAMLDREGVAGPADIGIVGSEKSVASQIRHLEEVGATEFMAIPFGDEATRQRTRDLLVTLGH